MSQDRDFLLENGGEKNSSTQASYDNIDTQILEDPIGPPAVDNHPRKCRQLVAGFSAALSALSSGLVLGWTSPILTELTNGEYNHIKIDERQMGWIGSFATLGAMTMCIPTGFVCDSIGRKRALLLLLVPFTLGWGLIIWARNPIEIYFGRLVTGMGVGACCIATPLYNGEIAHKKLRGALGSCFQLMITVGIFVAYLVGKYLEPFKFTVFCAGVPFVFALTFVFQPESPTHLIRCGRPEAAKKCLLILRGDDYDVDAELAEIEGSLKENAQTTVSFRNTFARKSVRKAVLIAFSLMFFQQFSGINTVILYSSDIIKSTGVKLDPNTASIMIGGFQVMATFFSSLVIDKTGRKLLLVVSSSLVSFSAFFLALYFTVKPDTRLDLGFLPVTSLCTFVIAFSLGLGPIPWMISSEILPVEIRSVISSTAGTFNWFLAFVLTKFYLEICHGIGDNIVFYAFTGFTLSGILFVVFLVPETKGKNVAEIQEELER